MNQNQLRISNYNYTATQFLEQVRGLFARDRWFLGDVIQRSALVRTPSGDLQHGITRIDILPKEGPADQPEVLDYGTILFSREMLDEEALLARLSKLVNNNFVAGEHTLTSTGMGFFDRYEPSRNSYSEWPCTLFDISFGSTQFSLEPLLHPTLRSFPSPFEAIREFLGFEQFHDSSDARLGHIIVSFPNLNLRLDKLGLKGRSLQVTVSGRTAPTAFKLDISYKTPTESRSIEKLLSMHEDKFELAFIPSELRLWLIAKQGFLADFHDENEYYSVGANAVLKKRTAALMTTVEPNPEMFSVDVIEPTEAGRIFIIHSHNSSVKEGVARFLEKLGLEAVILHEQPNRGATIIEKFQLYSDVAFAVALLTGDDEAREVATKNQLRRRARQNVVFEFGYFIGKLGLRRVCALVEEGVEIPSDYQGVVFIPLDSAGHWRFDLIRELKAAGLNVDANLAL